MTLGPPVQVGQSAASGALTETYPVVDHGKGEALIVGLDEDPDLRGPSMLCDVGQRFPQHGLDIGDDRVVSDRVERPRSCTSGRTGSRGES